MRSRETASQVRSVRWPNVRDVAKNSTFPFRQARPVREPLGGRGGDPGADRPARRESSRCILVVTLGGGSGRATRRSKRQRTTTPLSRSTPSSPIGPRRRLIELFEQRNTRQRSPGVGWLCQVLFTALSILCLACAVRRTPGRPGVVFLLLSSLLMIVTLSRSSECLSTGISKSRSVYSNSVLSRNHWKL